MVYGAEKGKAVEIAVDPKTLLRILHSESGVNTLIGLQLDGGDTRVLVKEYQLDPIDHKLLHADFYQVAMDKMLTVTVPIVLKGEAKGVKQQGGIVDFVNREIEIEVLPGDIPENITVDISELMLNQGVRVRDLQTEGAKWKAVSDADMMIVHVVRAEGRGSAGGGRCGGRGAGGAGRARSHQEGQDRQGRGREAREEEVARPCSSREQLNEARCRSGQSRAGSTPARGTTSASRSLDLLAGRHGSSGSRRRPRRCIAKWRPASALARQAADVHEPERPRDRRAAAVLQDRRCRTCWSSSTT